MEQRWKDFGLFYLAIFLLILAGLVFYFNWQKDQRVLTFAMLDVGQGDALFIESPTGTQLLVDTGPLNNVLGALPQVMPFWDRSLDAVIITNPDTDHIGGLDQVLKLYDVDVVFESGTYNSSTLSKKINTTIEKEKIPNVLLRKGMQIDLGGEAYLEVLFPDREVLDWSTNDGSAVLRLVYGQHTFMLMGDATAKTEELILSTNQSDALQSDFLKVGHHGSRTSTTIDFLEVVKPQNAFISNGVSNSYGHPHKEVLANLAEVGARIWRTDTFGTVLVKCDKMSACKINKSRN